MKILGTGKVIRVRDYYKGFKVIEEYKFKFGWVVVELILIETGYGDMHAYVIINDGHDRRETRSPGKKSLDLLRDWCVTEVRSHGHKLDRDSLKTGWAEATFKHITEKLKV